MSSKNKNIFSRKKLKNILKTQDNENENIVSRKKIKKKSKLKAKDIFTRTKLKDILKTIDKENKKSVSRKKIKKNKKIKAKDIFSKTKITIFKRTKITFKKVFSKILLLTYILSFIFLQDIIGISYAVPTTPGYVGTATNIGGGTFGWVNPNNVIGNTTTTAVTSTITTRRGYTDNLSVTNFNLATAGLPTGATINGIQVDVETLASGNGIKDTTIQLTKDGTNTIGNNYGNNANRSQSKSTTTYGGVADLWGTTWTDTELLSSNFGVILQYRNTNRNNRTVNLYRVWITVDYTPANSSPGGVGSNMQLWLKADAGTSTTTDGNSLTTWNDQSGNGFNAGGGVSPTYFNTTTDLNFNPVVDFNGTTQYLENLNNGVYTQSYFAVVIPDEQVDGTLGGQAPFAFDCYAATFNTSGCGLAFGGLLLGAFTVAINDEVITHAIGSSNDWRSAQVGQGSYDLAKPMLINMNENAAGTGTEISEKGLILDNYNANTYQTLGATDYRIGMSTDPNYPFPYNGKIAEIINYSSRTSPTDKQKIESYLSLKYGMTLNNGNTNYIASDGTTNIWTTLAAGIYINDIFGIGRDDQSELGQIKSKSINNDNVITIEAIGEGTNASPTFTDITDKEFLSIANNGLGNTWSAIDSPSGYYILERKWKAQETGEVGTINLDFDVANTNFDIPVTNTGTTYYYIYDSNNNGSLSDETPSAMTNTTGNIWQTSGVNINHERIFTIASAASLNNIPTDISLTNNSINENVVADSTIGTLSSTDADSGDSHTYSLVIGTGDDDNEYLIISGTTLSLIHSPDYEIKQTYNIRVQTDDGNEGQFQKAFTININNLGETIPSSLDFENPLNAYKYTVTSGTWSRTTTNPYEGTYSFESNNGGANNTQSCFEVNNTLTQTGTINYYYNVSSQSGSDFLRFYIDNVEQQAWSGTVPWTQYTKNDVAPGTHIYKWCYIKDTGGSAGTDNAYIDFVATEPTTGESNPPIISSINYASGTLLPGGNHNIIINYSDLESGINTTSDTITLYKWNGIAWGADISTTGFNLGAKNITTTSATYPTNNLDFGKYRYEFFISDNDTNTSSTGAVFYIDIPEFIISTGSTDIGNIGIGTNTFSQELNITVKTVGAPFDVILNNNTPLSYSGAIIQNWDGIKGFGYDNTPYTLSINTINTDEIIGTQLGSINTNGNKTTYNYNIKLGAKIDEEQVGGNYIGNVDFDISLNY